jgi:hypothetical protein
MEVTNVYSDIYEHFIDNQDIKTSRLKELGYDFNAINYLINQGVLIRVKQGYYQILDVEGLYHYGKKLIAEKKYDRVTECFKKCYEINPAHKAACFQLFIRAIDSKDYNEALKYFDGFCDNDNQYYKTDSSFYLFLLDNVTELPKKYKDIVQSLTYDDIKIIVGDKRFPDWFIQNKIRYWAFNHNFAKSYDFLRQSIDQGGVLHIQNKIIGNLLQDLLRNKRTDNNTMLDYLKSKNYQQMGEFLVNKGNNGSLNLSERYYLKIIQQYLKIERDKSWPVGIYSDASNVFEAVDYEDYRLALKLNNKFNEQQGIDFKSSIMNLLLNDIVNLMEDIIKEKQNEVKPASKSVISTKVEDHPEIDSSLYMQYFYQKIADNKIEEAKSYLDIIIKLNKLDKSIIEGLKKVLSIIEEANKIADITSSVIENKAPLNGIVNNQDLPSKSNKEKRRTVINQIVPSVESSASSTRIYDSEEKYIIKKIDIATNTKAPVIVDLKDDNRLEAINEAIKDKKELTYFIIGKEKERKLVLRYVDVENIDLKVPLAEINHLFYQEHNYSECIKKIKEAMIHVQDVKPFLYYLLGMCYHKLYKRREAINYLTIAQGLNEQEPNNKHDLRDLLAYLKGEILPENLKPVVKINPSEFNKTNKAAHVDNLDNIRNMIIKKQNINEIIRVCEQLGLDKEKIYMGVLIVIKELFVDRRDALAEEYLRTMMYIKDKPNEVKTFLQEIQKSKKFYGNHRESNS